MGTRDYPITAEERRYIALWKQMGGSQHGPRVETVTMPYEKFFEFCAALESAWIEEPTTALANCIRNAGRSTNT